MSGEFNGFFIIKLLKKPLLYFVMLQSTWEVGRNTHVWCSPYISFVPQPGAFYVIYNRTEHVVKEDVVHVVKEAKEAVLYFVKDFKVNFWQLNVLIYLY